MNYAKSYVTMKEAFSSTDPVTEVDNIEFRKFPFHSNAYSLLPGKEDYFCQVHNEAFTDNLLFYNDIGTIQYDVHMKDVYVEENHDFEYHLIRPKGAPPAKKVIFMFHGFNEKNWEKYLPWAKALCDRTQSTVVLFPIAFHMQRAPLPWSEKRKMYDLSKKRRERYPNIIHSTLSNVAISMRLHSMPQRFIWSGLETYYDAIQFIEECKNGKNELIDKDFTFDIFAYSIGGLLAEILKLSNHQGYFTDTKVCLFCSGAVFNRLSPVSKFILDSEANVALYSYLVEHFDSFLKKDAHLQHYIEGHLEGKVFRSMLEYQKMRAFREDLLRKHQHQIYAISLKKDSVIPSFEIMNTLQGAFRDIDIKVDEHDFEFSYTHENPFPLNPSQAEKVEQQFNLIFDKIAGFLS
ncbi:MAG: hypothetical protein JXR71_01280 [Bacteroidales bacterium]|nr:hypothetical protein [Bacteroidales bacterium]